MSMEKRLLPALAAGILVFALSTAPATFAEEGFYLQGQAGVSLPEDSNLESGGTELDAGLDTGWTSSIGAGYAYGNGFRTEFEIGYHANDVDDVSGTSASGDVDALSLMVNGYYDFFRDSKWQPYIGIGFGGARVDASGVSPTFASSIDDDDLGFAWQGMAGVAYAVTETIRLTLGYRYFSVPDLSFNTAAGASVESDYASHDLLLGIRFLFGAPRAMPAPEPVQAPPPEPAPAPMPAPEPMPEAAPAPAPPITRNFLVFFDWNSAALTAQARDIINSAASEARRAGPVRIRATGHADRSGASSYNQRLSMRRAIAVRGALEAQGIPRNEIAIFARGEAEPLVPTADGVREPQNRRVEIVLE